MTAGGAISQFHRPQHESPVLPGSYPTARKATSLPKKFATPFLTRRYGAPEEGGKLCVRGVGQRRLCREVMANLRRLLRRR